MPVAKTGFYFEGGMAIPKFHTLTASFPKPLPSRPQLGLVEMKSFPGNVFKSQAE